MGFLGFQSSTIFKGQFDDLWESLSKEREGFQLEQGLAETPITYFNVAHSSFCVLVDLIASFITTMPGRHFLNRTSLQLTPLLCKESSAATPRNYSVRPQLQVF